jgi:hypothetical protein
MLPYTLKLSCNLYSAPIYLHYILFQNYHGASLLYNNVLAFAMTYLLNPTNLIGHLNIQIPN